MVPLNGGTIEPVRVRKRDRAPAGQAAPSER